MTTCIKCGRPIPDGELFCRECALNPEFSPDGDPELPVQRRPLPPGQLRAPVKLPPKPAAPKTVSAPQVVVKRRSSKKLIAAFVIVCLIAAGALGALGYQLFTLARQKNALRTREADLSEREEELSAMQDEVALLTGELDAANDQLSQQKDQIESLQSTINEAESTVNQTQYDMTTQKTELEKLQKDNETLQTSIDSLNEQNDKLSGSVDALTDENKQLSALNVVYSEKAKFLDTYVVFVENDGTRLYHKYDCSHFARKSFWAYSRKLAEKYGFTACPYCFG